jgi:hypothetical protein
MSHEQDGGKGPAVVLVLAESWEPGPGPEGSRDRAVVRPAEGARGLLQGPARAREDFGGSGSRLRRKGAGPVEASDRHCTLRQSSAPFREAMQSFPSLSRLASVSLSFAGKLLEKKELREPSGVSARLMESRACFSLVLPI